jgi:hypothetical protein
MTSVQKFEIYRELQKELQDRKAHPVKLYYEEDFIIVTYDPENSWIYADWKGYQTEGSVKEGCEKILEALLFYQSRAVLNDNTHVLGIWTPAAAWVGSDWFPRMEKAGLQRFAWVYSPSAMSRVSTKESLRHTPNVHLVCTFFEMDEAKKWLKSL